MIRFGMRAPSDIAVTVDAGEGTQRQMLVGRWRGRGVSPVEIETKVEGDDLLNGHYVMSKSKAAGFVLRA